MNNLKTLADKLKVTFKDKALISRAFVHRSYLNEADKKIESNERLEFLGDSILSYIVSDYLFSKYGKLNEGELTNLRSSLVRTSTLAKMSHKLSLGNYLKLAKGEVESGGKKNISILADTFEAFLGALYLDQGLKTCKKILAKLLFPELEKIIKDKAYKDAKSTFQEFVQERKKHSPVYQVIDEKGPDHNKTFTVGVYVNDRLWALGEGKSKQKAEQEAAASALEKWMKKQYNSNYEARSTNHGNRNS